MRNLIVLKMNQGMKQIQVARELNITSGTVRKIWMRYKATGSTDDAHRSGRPLKTTERDRRFICMASRKDPFLSAVEIQSKVTLNPSVSNRTIRRVLNKSGLLSFKAAKKPKLSKVNVKKRIHFCKSYSHWTINQWEQVIFSDESRIHRFSNSRRLVRRPVGSRFKKRYTIKTVKYGGFSVHIWGAIRGDGKRILRKCPQRLNSKDYRNILEEDLLPFYQHENIFQQDGASCHRAKSIMDYIEVKGVNMISDWPPQSPDLSIIENVWALLKRNVEKRNAKTADELWRIIVEEWDKIPLSYINNLYGSIPGRLKMVLHNKGEHSRY